MNNIKSITNLQRIEVWLCEICGRNYATSNVTLVKTISSKVIPYPDSSCYPMENQFFLCGNKNCIEYLKLLAC